MTTSVAEHMTMLRLRAIALTDCRVLQVATIVAVHPVVAILMLHAQLGLYATVVPVRLNDLSRVLHRSHLLIVPSTCMHMIESNLRVQVPAAVLKRLLSRPCACHPSLLTTSKTCSVPDSLFSRFSLHRRSTLALSIVGPLFAF